MKNRYVSLLLLCCMLLSACAGQQLTGGPAKPVSSEGKKLLMGAKYEPVFEKLETCPFDQGSMFPTDMLKRDCGYLVVPEDRSLDDSPDIKIAVAIYHATGEAPKDDPLLILISNPSGEVSFSPAFSFTLSEILQERDIIAVDTRGTGFSQPAFHCQAAVDYYYAHLDQNPLTQSYMDGYTEAVTGCRQQWASLSQNLAAYTTQAAAADLEDLRVALGIQQWNVLGVAYGSRLVYVLLRDYSGGVRSAVVDVIEPLNGDTFTGKGALNQAIIEQFFSRCAADENCRSAYPDLQRVFYQALDKLNANPQVIQAQDLQNGGMKPLYLDGNVLVNMIVIAYSNNVADLLPELPRVIYQANSGDTKRLSDMLGELINYNSPSDEGMLSRIYCLERYQYVEADDVRRSDVQADPRIADANTKGFELNQDSCEKVWGDLYVKGGKLDQVSFSSNTPLLVIHGMQNSFSVETWAEEVAGRDSKMLLKVAGMGVFDWFFGGNKSACLKPIFQSYLNDPTQALETPACVAEPVSITWITFH